MVQGRAAGGATAGGTARFRARNVERGLPEAHFRSLHGLAAASIGSGTYLGNEDEATDAAYEASVRLAVELGSNVVDSAINYRAQRSERAVGRAIATLIAAGGAARDEVIVASKGGYIPFDGRRPANARAYISATYIEPGILDRSDIVAGCHSIAPRYLADQIERSRRNLRLDTIDIYYLHNPEQQLDEVDRREFLRRMRAAFEVLEEHAAEGVIGAYGTATWSGYREDPAARGYLSLDELVTLAREVGGTEHHFRVIQVPYNLGMTEAYALSNQRVGDARATPVLEAAKHHGIAVMASASVYQGHLTRGLPALLDEILGGLETDAQRALQFVRSTPGVTTALVGMKQIDHVRENLALSRSEPAAPVFLQRLFHAEGTG